MQLVVATYIVSRYDLELATRVGGMLAKQSGQRHQQSPDAATVREWFRTLPMDVLDGLNVPTTEVSMRLRREAVKLVAEVRTARWVCDENFGRGVAPASEEVARAYDGFVASLGDGPSTSALMRSAESGSGDGRRTLRAWAAGFRDRWGIANNFMACLDAPPVGQLGNKAGLCRNRLPRLMSRFRRNMVLGILRSPSRNSKAKIEIRVFKIGWNP